MKLGDFLKQERESKKWTQPEACAAIGIEQSYLSKLENDKAIPSAEIFDQLQKAYDFDIAKLGNSLNKSELDKFKEIASVRDFIIGSQHQNSKDRRTWLIRGLVGVALGVGLLSAAFIPQSREVQFYAYESKGVIKENESRFVFTEMPSFDHFKKILRKEGLDFVEGNDRIKTLNSEIEQERVKLKTTMQQQGSVPKFINPGIPNGLYEQLIVERFDLERRILALEAEVTSLNEEISPLKRHTLFPRLDYQIDRHLSFKGEFYDKDVEGGHRRYFLTDKEWRQPKGPEPFMVMIGAILTMAGFASFFISRRW